MEIQTFAFSEKGIQTLEKTSKGKNWPVVYLISNNDNIYIGETTSASTRMEQHLMNPQKQAYNLKEIRVVFDDTYNKSVILDYEQQLIKCFLADSIFEVINKNAGQSSSHYYYQREHYAKEFYSLWQKIVDTGMAKHPLSALENKEIFKYSPYNSLTEEQNEISVSIINDICDKFEHSKNGKGLSIVEGCAGTGKTVLAISIINSIVNAINLDITDLSADEMNSDKVRALLRLKSLLETLGKHTLTIGFVFPMSGIRGTIKKVFKASGNGLDEKMVISPYELKQQQYDILFVDESHRLFRRKNLGTSFKNFDITCTELGFEKDSASQLDWILKQGKYNVLFYDQDQSIKGSDITYSQYWNTIQSSGKSLQKYQLTTQMRCNGGDSYVNYIKDIMECKTSLKFADIDNYDFRIFDDVDVMVNQIRQYDEAPSIGISKTVAGYSWKWSTRQRPCPEDNMNKYNDLVREGKYDIEIDGHRYIWNLTTEDWISRQDSRYTIGCIHTTQGFDLNYVGVIFGREIDYDKSTNSITVDLNLFYDRNVKAGSPLDVVKTYIINTYTTMMARGIKGCYVYAYNDNLREYLSKFIRRYGDE